MKDARTLVTTAALTAALALVSYGPAQSAAALVVDPLPTYSHHALLIVHGHAPWAASSGAARTPCWPKPGSSASRFRSGSASTTSRSTSRPPTERAYGRSP